MWDVLEDLQQQVVSIEGLWGSVWSVVKNPPGGRQTYVDSGGWLSSL